LPYRQRELKDIFGLKAIVITFKVHQIGGTDEKNFLYLNFKNLGYSKTKSHASIIRWTLQNLVASG